MYAGARRIHYQEAKEYQRTGSSPDDARVWHSRCLELGAENEAECTVAASRTYATE